MADTTMCQESSCPRKDKCYRFTAKVNEYRQAYFADKMDTENCEYFIPNN